MAKLHLDGGVTFEGTPEEIKAYTDLYVVDAEKTQEAPIFKEGDIVVITGNTNAHGFEIGTVGKITCLDVSDDQHKVSYLDGHDWWWLEESEIRHATQAEREQYEANAKQAEKDAIFTKIGRKPGEFKKGDIVRVITGEFTRFEPGTIGELVSGAHFICPRKFGVKHGDATQDCYDDFELIAPVESRVDAN